MPSPQVGSRVVSDLSLRCYEWEGREPTIVFAHGSGSSTRTWFPIVDALESPQRVLAFDARGCGDSDRSERPYRMTDYGEELAAFVQLSCAQPPVIVGHSLGALSAIYLAGTHPSLARAVILEDPPIYVAEVGLRALRPAFELMQQLAGKPPDVILEAGAAFGVTRERAEDVSQIDPRLFQSILDASVLDGFEADKLLASIDCPVHLLVGNHDLGSTLDDQDISRATHAIRDCTVHPFPDAGHGLHTEQPERYLDVLRSSLAGLLR